MPWAQCHRVMHDDGMSGNTYKHLIILVPTLLTLSDHKSFLWVWRGGVFCPSRPSKRNLSPPPHPSLRLCASGISEGGPNGSGKEGLVKSVSPLDPMNRHYRYRLWAPNQFILSLLFGLRWTHKNKKNSTDPLHTLVVVAVALFLKRSRKDMWILVGLGPRSFSCETCCSWKI